MKTVSFFFFVNLRSHPQNGRPQNAGGDEEVTGLMPASSFFYFFFPQIAWPAQVLLLFEFPPSLSFSTPAPGLKKSHDATVQVFCQ